MSRRPTRALIEDMLERIARIELFVVGVDRDAFLRDEKWHAVSERRLGAHVDYLPENRLRHGDAYGRRLRELMRGARAMGVRSPVGRVLRHHKPIPAHSPFRRLPKLAAWVVSKGRSTCWASAGSTCG